MSEPKLGVWQAICILVIITINHIILDLPKSFIQSTSSGAILNVIFITIVALLIIYLISALLKNFPGLDIFDIAKFLGGKWLKVTLQILFICYILFVASNLLRAFSEGLNVIFFPRTPIPVIMLIFLIAIVVTNKIGISAITRSNLFFTGLVLFNILFVFIANWDNFIIERMYPLLGNGTMSTFFSGLSNLYAFGGISYLYLLPPYLRNEKDYKKVAFTSVAISGFYLLVSVATVLFMFPHIITTQQIFPIYLASRFIQFGTFFQRLDAVFLLIWLLSVISYLGIAFYFITNIFKNITNLKSNKWCVSLFAMIAFGIALIPGNMKEINFIENTVYKYIILILVFGICLSILVFANIKHLYIQKKKGVVSNK